MFRKIPTWALESESEIIEDDENIKDTNAETNTDAEIEETSVSDTELDEDLSVDDDDDDDTWEDIDEKDIDDVEYDNHSVDTSIETTSNSTDTSATLDVVDESVQTSDVAVTSDDDDNISTDTLSVNNGNEEMPATPKVDDAGAVTADASGDNADISTNNVCVKGGAGGDFIKGGEDVDPNTTPLVKQLISFDGDKLPITAVSETTASNAIDENNDKAEHEDLDHEIESLSEDTVVVEAIAIAAMEALQTGGMSEIAYRSNLATLRRKCERWGVSINTVGMESIATNRMTATREMADLANLACEGLLQKAASWIGNKIQKTNNAIKKIVNGTARMDKYHAKYKKSVDAVTYMGDVTIPWSSIIVDTSTGFVLDPDGQEKFITSSKLQQFDFKATIDIDRFAKGSARKIAKAAAQQITNDDSVEEEAYVIPGGIMAYTRKGSLQWELITRNASKTLVFGDIYRLLKYFDVRRGVKRNNDGKAAYVVNHATVVKLLNNAQLAINGINNIRRSWAKIEQDSKNISIDGTENDSDKSKESVAQYSNMSSVFRMTVTAYRNIARGNLEIARKYLLKYKKAAKKAEKTSMRKLNALVEENMATTKPASNEQITAAQTALGMKFSDEYRTYLSEFGTIVHESTELYGLGMSDSSHLNIVKAVKTFKEVCDFPKNLIPLAEISDGNYYVYDNSGKKVLTFNQSTLETKSYGSGLEQALINIVFK